MLQTEIPRPCPASPNAPLLSSSLSPSLSLKRHTCHYCHPPLLLLFFTLPPLSPAPTVLHTYFPSPAPTGLHTSPPSSLPPQLEALLMSLLSTGHPNIVHTYKCLASWRDLSGPDQERGAIKV